MNSVSGLSGALCPKSLSILARSSRGSTGFLKNPFMPMLAQDSRPSEDIVD